VVYRAQAELSVFIQKETNASKERDLAASYVNFLLNRPLTDSIFFIAEMETIPSFSISTDTILNRTLTSRVEIRQVQLAVKSAGYGIQLSKSGFLPSLFVVADYGFQGEQYRFNQNNDYWMASAVLTWNLFSGFQDKAKVQQSRLTQQHYNLQLQELKKKLQLQAQNAGKSVQVALKAMTAAEDGVISARQTFRIVDKKYREGMISQIELIETRNSLVQAEMNRVITCYDYRISLAELERVTADPEITVLINSVLQDIKH